MYIFYKILSSYSHLKFIFVIVLSSIQADMKSDNTPLGICQKNKALFLAQKN